jgi:hypothetical protein
MRRWCVTTPQNPKDNHFIGVIHFPQPPERSRRTIQPEKSWGICFWDRKGFLLVDFMPNGTTINAEAYCNTLKKLRRAIQKRRRGMLIRGVSFLHDNARSYTAPVSQELLTSFGWVIVIRLGAFGLSLFH